VIRRAPSILAVSTLSVLAVACGAAPEAEEPTASAASADTVLPPSTACPLAQYESTKVWIPYSPPDPEEGILHGTPAHWETAYYCNALTGAAPATPAGGWGNRVASCSQLDAVLPPAALFGCTAGYQYTYADANGSYGEAAFICPAGMAAPADDPNASPPIAYFANETPADGCLGPVLDTNAWQYMLVQWGNVPDPVALKLGFFPPPKDEGMNCGAGCGCL